MVGKRHQLAVSSTSSSEIALNLSWYDREHLHLMRLVLLSLGVDETSRCSAPEED
jgi:hypothetical protein